MTQTSRAPPKSAREIADQLAAAQQQVRRRKIVSLKRRFPGIEDEEAASYLEMASLNVDQAARMLERDHMQWDARDLGTMTKSFEFDTLCALETLG